MFKLNHHDFYVLREPLKSGRQSPDSLAAVLFLAVFLQFVCYFAFYFFVDPDSHLFIRKLKEVHFQITFILSVLSVIFALPPVFKRLDRTQYLLSIVISQNVFGAYSYAGGIILLTEDSWVTKESLFSFILTTLSIGLAFLIFTCIRFIILLRKGEYRKGGKKDVKGRFDIASVLPFAISTGLAFVYVLQFYIRYSGLGDVEELFYVLICFGLFYTMIFVLPEQLVILYCKFRFKSFTFNTSGYLRDEDVKTPN